jgi:hypothetical protein
MLLGSSTRRLVTLLTGELVARFDVLVAALLKTEISRDATVCRRVNVSDVSKVRAFSYRVNRCDFLFL